MMRMENMLMHITIVAAHTTLSVVLNALNSLTNSNVVYVQYADFF